MSARRPYIGAVVVVRDAGRVTPAIVTRVGCDGWSVNVHLLQDLGPSHPVASIAREGCAATPEAYAWSWPDEPVRVAATHLRPGGVTWIEDLRPGGIRWVDDVPGDWPG